MLAQIDESTEPEQWASVQFVIGSAALYLGVQVPNYKDAAEFRSQAVAAARATVDASSKQKDPKKWAEYANYYALMLATTSTYSYHQGQLSEQQASESLSQAVDQLRSVLEIRTRSENPLDWANAQMLIGDILSLQSMRTSGKHATELLTQAEASTRAALEVFTKADHPEDWSMAERSLGNVLLARAQTTSGNQAHDLTLQGAAAIQTSLQGTARQKDPLDWANAQHSLADLLHTESKDFSGSQAIDLLTQSAVALRFELEVITKASAPLRWAGIQIDLGSVLTQLADRYNSQAQATQAADCQSQAAAAYRAALEVYNRQNNSDRWARTQWALGAVLFAQSQTATPNQSTDLLAQAAAAYTGALEVITMQTSPQDWGNMQTTLGQIRGAQGVHSSGRQAKEFFTQSAEALSAALQVAPKNANTLSLISSLYHDFLIDFPKAYDYATRAEAAAPNDGNKLNLAEAALTTSRFSTCIDLINSVNQAQLDPRYTSGRLTLLFACQWGAGQHPAASQTAEALAASAATLTKQDWSTAGDRVYLAAAPEFSANHSLWIKLFQSLEQGDGPSLADAAHTIHQGAGN
jgi:tetratricopeptide (TPR) repeat protein